MAMLKGVKPRRLIITIAVLLAIGTGVTFAAYQANPTKRDWAVMLCDILFSQASAIIIWGIIRILGNVHMFTSVTYSFKRFRDVLRNKFMKADVMKEDYITYRESRPYHPDAKLILLIGVLWMIVAIAASQIAAPIQ